MIPLIAMALRGVAMGAAKGVASVAKGVASAAKGTVSATAKLAKSSGKAKKISSAVKKPPKTPGDKSNHKQISEMMKAEKEAREEESPDAQLAIEQKKHDKIVEEALLAIKRAEETTAEEAEESNEKEQNEGFGKKTSNFIKAGVVDTKEKISKLPKASKAGLLGLFAGAIIGLIVWWTSKDGPGGHRDGLVGWTKDLLADWWENFDFVGFLKKSGSMILDFLVGVGDLVFLLADKLTDWLIYDVDWPALGKTIMDALQNIGDFSLWMIDTIYEALFGTNWIKAKAGFAILWAKFEDWWDSIAIPIKRWWVEVEHYKGVVGWVEAKIKNWWYDLIGGIDFPWPVEWMKEALLGEGVTAFKEDQKVLKKKLDVFDDKQDILKKLEQGRRDEYQEEMDDKIAEIRAEKKAQREGRVYEPNKTTNNRTNNFDMSRSNKNNKQYNTNVSYNTHSNKIGGGNKSYNMSKNNSINLSNIDVKKGHTEYEGENKQPWMKVITSKYGVKENVRNNRAHSGVDFRAPMNTEVTAVAPGMVETWQPRDKRGGMILITKGDDGKRVLYMHLNRYKISPGQRVKPGDVVGLSGNTGTPVGGGKYAPHIHIGVKDAKTGQTEDPITYISSLGGGKKDQKGIVESINDTGGQVMVTNNTTKIKSNTTNINNENGKLEAVAKTLDSKINELNKRVADNMADKGQYTLMATKVEIEA